MRLLSTITLTFLILLSVTSCDKGRVCADGIVTYKEVVTMKASIFSFSTNGNATVDLGGMTGDVKITPADAKDGVVYSTGDVNLNGHKLTLKNVTLIVTGNLNGGGSVATKGEGALCVEGNIQNNPDLSKANQDCSTLSNDDFDTIERLGTECDLGSFIYVGGKTYEAVEFNLL